MAIKTTGIKEAKKLNSLEKQQEERDVRQIAPEFNGDDFLDNYMNSNFPQTRFINKNKKGTENDPLYDPLEEGKKEDAALMKVMSQTQALKKAQQRKLQSGISNQQSDGTNYDNPAQG